MKDEPHISRLYFLHPAGQKKKKKWCIIRGFRYEKAVNARLFEEKEQEWCPENSSVLCALKPWMPMGREIY